MQHETRSFILVILASLLTASAAFATVTVTVSSPANNSTVPTTLNFVASATTDASGARVTGWFIYVDSVAAFRYPSRRLRCAFALIPPINSSGRTKLNLAICG